MSRRAAIIEVAWISFGALLLVIAFPVSEAMGRFFGNCGREHLLFIAFVPLFLALSRPLSNARAFSLGYLFGCIFFYGSLSWIVITMTQYGNMPAFLSYLVLVLLVMWLGLFSAIFAMVTAWLRRVHGLPLTLTAPGLWVLMEYHRGWLLSGFPWNLLGYGLHQHKTLIQIADITGVYGLSFLIIMVNAAIVDLLSTSLPLRRRLALFILIVTLTGATYCYGYRRLGVPETGEMLTVSCVQGNFRQEEKWEEGGRDKALTTYLALTESASPHRPALVIWPEAALPFKLRYSPIAFNEIADCARAMNTTIVVGSPDRMDSDAVIDYYNSAFVISADGLFQGRYDKIHLVPFGEYVPLQRILFFVDKMTEGAAGNFSAGTTWPVFHEPRPFSVFICYETIFPDLLRVFALRGARLFASITNDAWFERSAAGYQHFAMTVFRAIENRVPVCRAANTGISGFIDASGTVLAASSLFERTVVTREVRLRPADTLTFYTRHGDFFVLCISLYVLLVAVIPLRRTFRHEHS